MDIDLIKQEISLGEDSRHQLKQDMPFKGLGSGIRRALNKWSSIDFLDDREGALSIATISRTRKELAGKSSGKGSGKSSGKILDILTTNTQITIPQLAEKLGITSRAVEKQIAKLKKENLLERVGPARGGIGKFGDKWGFFDGVFLSKRRNGHQYATLRENIS